MINPQSPAQKKYANERFTTFKFPKDSGVTLLQTMPVEADMAENYSLAGGGYTKVDTAEHFRHLAAGEAHVAFEEADFGGVGATPGLGKEITHKGRKVYIIAKKSATEVDPVPGELTQPLSFSQVAALSPEFTVQFSLESAKDRTDLIQQIIEKVSGRTESAVITIKAFARYIKSRAVDNDETKVAGPLAKCVEGQAVAEFKDKIFSGAGVFTGTEMFENFPIIGDKSFGARLHLHSKMEGHLLDFKDLKDIRITYTPIKETLIRMENGEYRKAVHSEQEAQDWRTRIVAERAKAQIGQVAAAAA